MGNCERRHNPRHMRQSCNCSERAVDPGLRRRLREHAVPGVVDDLINVTRLRREPLAEQVGCPLGIGVWQREVVVESVLEGACRADRGDQNDEPKDDYRPAVRCGPARQCLHRQELLLREGGRWHIDRVVFVILMTDRDEGM